MGQEFGSALREWRQQRRLSQLDLGLGANVSARHISFLETGRSRPSRAMVLQLCEELQVPRAGRNRLLTAAGLAPAYVERALSDEQLQPILSAVDWILERHDPYPAFAMNRHWRLQKMNPSAQLLLAGMGIQQGDSMLETLADNEAVQNAITNLDEVLTHVILRVRTEIAHLGHDPVLENALERLSAQLGRTAVAPEGILPAFVPTRYRLGDIVLSLFSTFTQFGTAEDIALSELKIEMLFPADEQTRAFLESIGPAT
ncbi:MAG: helix-turn-helix transcriptional regulator [Pseudomonadota bacterium]